MNVGILRQAAPNPQARLRSFQFYICGQVARRPQAKNLSAGAALFCLLSLGCASASRNSRVVNLPDRPSGQIRVTSGPSDVGTYISSPRGFSTASYWIEGPQGLVLVDTQFLLSAAKEAVDWAESITGKKVVAAVILHPNPDKFNGTDVLKKRGIRVITSEQVLAAIPEVHKDRHYWFYDRYRPDYPDLAPHPESFGPRTTSLNLAGLTFQAHVLGQGCSEAHVVLQYGHHLFVGDLIASLGHPWLELGYLNEWLKRLDEMDSLNPEFVYPGRGPSGGRELIERQRRYLTKVLFLVNKEKKAGTPRDRALKRIQQTLENEHPGYSNPYFLEIGLPAVWSR